MNLDLQVRALLERQRELDLPAYHMTGVTGARASSRAITAWRHTLAGVDEGVASAVDVRIPSVAGPVAARIYTPVSAPVGVVTYFHGGGFVVGDLDTCEAHCRAICARSSTVVVSVDYRLAPEAPFPAAAHDAYAAIRWVAENLKGEDGGSLPYAVAGDSAGGNLAVTAALLARDTGYPQLDGQLLIYPMLDPTMSAASITEFGDGYMLDQPTLEWFWAQYLGSTDRKSLSHSPLATPLDANLSGLPAAVVVTAELDPLRDEGERFADRLRAAGVRTELRRYRGLVHGFFGWGAYVGAAQVAVSEVCTALKDVLMVAGRSSAKSYDREEEELRSEAFDHGRMSGG